MRPIYNAECSKCTVKSPKETSSFVRRTIAKLTQEPQEQDSNSSWYIRSVKNLINVFEQKDKSSKQKRAITNLSRAKSKSYATMPPNSNVSITKSVVNFFETSASSKPKISDLATLELDAIKHNALTLKSKIDNNSENVDNKQYISYQNQIIGLLTKIGNLESNGNTLIKQEKQNCLRMVQNCNTMLKKKMALVNYCSVIKQPQEEAEAPNENLKVSKVQLLKTMFESKKATQNNNISSQKAIKCTTKPRLLSPPPKINNQVIYVPKRFGPNADKRAFELSKSCENISHKEYSGIKRLLERIRSAKDDLGSTKSLVNGHLPEFSLEDENSPDEINSSPKHTTDDEKENETLDKCEVELVSVKFIEEADENCNIRIEKTESEVIITENGYLKAESVGSSDEQDSDTEDLVKIGGFYSLVDEDRDSALQTVAERIEEGKQSDDDNSENTSSTVRSKRDSPDDYCSAAEDFLEYAEKGALVSNVFVDYSGENAVYKRNYKEVIYNNCNSESSMTSVV